MRSPKPEPKTCTEAADRFREWHNAAWDRDNRARFKAVADTLAMFGAAPVPQKMLDTYDFSR